MHALFGSPLSSALDGNLMETLAAALPELSAELERALADLGQGELGRRFAAAPVREVTFSSKAGYIQLAKDPMGAGQTLHLQETKSFVVLDIGADGNPIGVEVLAPGASIMSELRRRAAV